MAYGIVSSLVIVGSIVGTVTGVVLFIGAGKVMFAGGGSFCVGGGSMMGCGGDIRHVGFSFGGATRSCRVGVEVNIGGSGSRGVMSTAMFV